VPFFVTIYFLYYSEQSSSFIDKLIVNELGRITVGKLIGCCGDSIVLAITNGYIIYISIYYKIYIIYYIK